MAPPRRPGPASKPRSPRVQPGAAFCVFLVANAIAALLSPIQDCDEVFNYWEPTHYLNHGYGLQTWEYSPEFAIRSWAYAGLHALVIRIGQVLPLGTKTSEFYFLRLALATACALSETRLYAAISRAMNPRVAIFFLMAMLSAPGMYHAAPAYLPSSFAMYTAMLGFAACLHSHGARRTAQGIFWFALGAALGWPFAGALMVPFLLEEVWLVFVTGQMRDASLRIAKGAYMSLFALVCIDSFFYRKLSNVPLNIVLYNVFSGSNKGPAIYGVEPWHFYIRNLALNFHIWFLLAMCSLPLLLMQYALGSREASRVTLLRGVVFLSPFYLWFAIFTLQPHKEERFMYPAYPALAFNAAMALHIILVNFGSSNPRHLVSRIPAQVKLAVASSLVLGALNVGALRTLGTMTAFSAPLAVYAPLQKSHAAVAGDNVCLGKEWYRFPSSYFLPEHVKAKFIRSEFTGLLPGEFKEASFHSGFYPGTWVLPSGMNDENREDAGKYIDLQQCTFLVDSYFAGKPASALEPSYVADEEEWERLACEPFLDASQTGAIARLLWVPDWPFMPERYRRKWGEYCLLRRRRQSGKGEP